MKLHTKLMLTTGLVVATGFAVAQGPGRGPRGGGGGPGGPGGGGGRSLTKEADANDLATRMLAFDANGDGVLTKDEVTDSRLVRIFMRADTNKDGKVTKAELVALGEKEHAGGGGGGFGGGPNDGPPGGGPPGGFGGGPGGPGGPGRMRLGDILPAFLQDRLELSEEQVKQVAALQKEVDSKLAKILTKDQNAELKQMRERGPGRGPGGPGFGPPPGGPGGPRGGPGGPPPGEDR